MTEEYDGPNLAGCRGMGNKIGAGLSGENRPQFYLKSGSTLLHLRNNKVD